MGEDRRFYAHIQVEPGVNGYPPSNAQVELYRIERWTNDMTPQPLFWKKGSHSNADATWFPDDAEWLVKGTIRYDGCANLDFGYHEKGEENDYIHLCGPEDAESFGKALKELYEIAQAEIEAEQ